MRPTQQLPEGYTHRGTLDLSRNRGVLIGLNAAGLVLVVLFTIAFLTAARAIRPEAASLAALGFISRDLPTALRTALGMLAIILVMTVVHEAVHGVFFWLYTRQRPRFGFRGAYAYASAPDWYIPRGQYLVVGLAPLVLISLAGLALLFIVPESWLPAVLVALVFNASGAVGDLAMTGWLLTRSGQALARDMGDAVAVYDMA